MTRTQTISVVMPVLIVACVEPYYPKATAAATQGYLVIDGFIDAVESTATVKLSRTILITQYRDNPTESDATVRIESENGTTINLTDDSNGLYHAEGLTLDPSTRYRLRVITSTGANYSSDLIELKRSPSFDSLVWRGEDGGTRFYVNGHDETGNTHYYRYRFSETWEYRVPIFSHYKKEGQYPVRRTKYEYVDTCWNSRRSTPVLIQSTIKTTKDAVIMFPINFIKKGDRVFAMGYSILAEQRALSEEEYQYWDLIRKTTETGGGLFDPIPSSVNGNVHSDDNSSEMVLGYFSGGYPQQKRIFITLSDLPKDLHAVDALPYQCNLSTVTLNHIEDVGSNIYVEIADPMINQYYVASPECADCRMIGGDTIRPKFWPGWPN